MLLVGDLHEKVAQVAQGKGAREARRPRQLPPRERVQMLLAPGTPFLELAAGGASSDDDEAPCAGVVTGIGRVAGIECVTATTLRVKGGSYFPLTVKKHLRAQEIARENRLPCIYPVDWAANLPTQTRSS